jgi:hypothetical protein
MPANALVDAHLGGRLLRVPTKVGTYRVMVDRQRRAMPANALVVAHLGGRLPRVPTTVGTYRVMVDR